MNIYIIQYFLLGLHTFLSRGFRAKGKKRLYLIGCVELLLLVILRSPTDANWPDSIRYLDRFTYFNSHVAWSDILETGWEPGIVILSKIIGILGYGEQLYIIVLGVFILIPIFMMIWKYSEYPCLSLLIFYAMDNLITTSIYRQWCAIAILTFAIKYVYQKRILPFSLLVLVAFLFHRTAIIFIIVYFIRNIKINFNKMIILLFCSGGIFLFGSRVLSFLNRFARIEQGISTNGGTSFLIVLWGVVFLSYFLLKKQFDNLNLRLPFNIVLLAAVLQPLSFTFSLWYRVVLYFSLFTVILIPSAMGVLRINNENNKNIIILVEIILVIIMFGWFCVGGIPQYVPLWAK